jgi:uncharacterized protein (TIGR03382 family)
MTRPISTTALVTAVAALAATNAHASRAGLSGRAESGCSMAGCHGGGTEPTVSIDGPTTLAPGATGDFTVTVTGPQAGARVPAAGFNIAAEDGTLAPADAQLKAVVAELVQNNMPAAFNGDSVTVPFRWTAPDTAGDYDLFAAGNSVNGDFVPSGDGSATTSFTVAVEAGGGPVGGTPGPVGGTPGPVGGTPGPVGGTPGPVDGAPVTGTDAGVDSGDSGGDSGGCQAAPGRSAPVAAAFGLLALPLLRRRRR